MQCDTWAGTALPRPFHSRKSKCSTYHCALCAVPTARRTADKGVVPQVADKGIQTTGEGMPLRPTHPTCWFGRLRVTLCPMGLGSLVCSGDTSRPLGGEEAGKPFHHLRTLRAHPSRLGIDALLRSSMTIALLSTTMYANGCALQDLSVCHGQCSQVTKNIAKGIRR